ncbi:MAG: methyltransferase domain-containing protein [Bacteroidales bacterium]|nr:methyltransferase domain-containing protein [Bacteroidales bacterium]
MQTDTTTITSSDTSNESACACGSGGCGCHSGSPHSSGTGYNLPDRFQLLQEGDKVVEFGSGLGNDAISVASIVGPEGKVIGIDINDTNISKSRQKARISGIENIEFIQGDITAAPVPDEWADIVYTSCVFNLQSDKQKAADEMYRVIRHNGYVCVSDFVILRDIPDGLRKEAAELVGCIAGVEKAPVFMDYFKKTGFTKGQIVEVNKVKLPDELLSKYLDAAEMESYNNLDSDDGVFSVVLVVEKPETCSAETCCHNPDKHKH